MKYLIKFEEHFETESDVAANVENKNYKELLLDDFINQNRDEIIEYIRSKYPSNKKLNYEELEILVWNDEYLSDWAKEEGVKLSGKQI